MNGFRIGDFLVVPDRNIVAGPAGAETHLEPKVMQVLCALARRQGEVVSRQALMDECWGVEGGADEGVTRAISKLRKELQDSSAAPHIIETIPKSGYRLALPVEPGDSSATRRTTAAAAVPVAGKSLLRRRTKTFALAFSAAVVAATFWLRDDEAVLAPNPPVIAVLPFDVAGEDEAGRAFALNFSSDLHYGMSRSGPGVKLIGWSSSSYFDEGRKRLEDIRTELDVTHLLSGSVARAGDRIAISVELIDAGTGVQEWGEEFSSDLRDEEHLMSRIVARARDALDVARAQADGAQSYDRRAVELYYSVTDKTPEPGAVNALRQAVEIEPGFARAWRRLAWAYMSLRWYADTPEQRREANIQGRLAASRYTALAPEDPDGWVTLGLFVFDRDEARPHFQRATQLDANNSGVLEMRLLLLIKSGRGEEALALSEQALVLDPLRWGIVWRRAAAAMISERFDVAEAAIRGMDPAGAVEFWPAVIMARLARDEPMEARTALQELESTISAFERTAPATDSRKSAVRLMRDRFSELTEVVAALEEGDADSRRALAATLFERASGPAAESGADYAYLVELPAISLLDGVDRAFEAWDRRLDLLPPYDADYPTNDHRSDVFSFQDNGYLPGFRLLHRDPRFWSSVARYDPRVFVVPTSPHGPPPPQKVVDPIWDRLWPPDFCRSQNFPYDCDAVASAAFAEAGRERQVSVATEEAE